MPDDDEPKAAKQRTSPAPNPAPNPKSKDGKSDLEAAKYIFEHQIAIQTIFPVRG